MRPSHHVRIVTALLTIGAARISTAEVVCGAINIVAAENGGRVVAASSEVRERGQVSRRWRKENLIDGKHVEGPIVPADSYGWATETPPSPRQPHWVVFAFSQDKPRLIGAVRLDPRTYDPQIIGRWVRNFRIEVSLTTPEGPWESVGSFELINQPVPQTFTFETPVLAKYVRLVITSNQMSNVRGSTRVSLGEFEVYEALVGDDELVQIISGLERLAARLRRYALGKGATLGVRPNELPPYETSLIARARGGSVVRASSEASQDDAGSSGASSTVLEQWRAENLIDGIVTTPEDTDPPNSFGWSSNVAPSENAPEWVIFQVPGETPVIIDSAVVDTRTRDGWAMLRGARQIRIETSIAGPDGPWKSVGQWELPSEPGPRLVHFPPAEARWVRLCVLSNYGSDRYVQLGEFGVFRLSPEVSPLGGISLELDNVLADLKKAHGGAFGANPAAPK